MCVHVNKIMEYGMIMTPALIADGKVKLVVRLPLARACEEVDELKSEDPLPEPNLFVVFQPSLCVYSVFLLFWLIGAVLRLCLGSTASDRIRRLEGKC